VPRTYRRKWPHIYQQIFTEIKNKTSFIPLESLSQTSAGLKKIHFYNKAHHKHIHGNNEKTTIFPFLRAPSYIKYSKVILYNYTGAIL
jgi:hypothetical protein